MNLLIEKNRLTPEDYITLRPEIPFQLAVYAIQGSSMTLRATWENHVIGMLRVLTDGAMFCYIQDVFIQKEFRGRGFGRELIEYALAWIQYILPSEGYMIVTLVADPGMESFYEHLGFIQAPNALYGHAMQCIISKENREE